MLTTTYSPSSPSTYSVSFREPYLLESNYFLDTRAFFFTRDRDKYNEQRIGATVGFGQNFGDVWSASIRGRGEVGERGRAREQGYDRDKEL